MPLTLTDTQKATGTFKPVDAKGNPTDPAGPLVVTTGDPAVLEGTTLDATTFQVRAIGPLGADVQVSVTDGVATAVDTVTVKGSAEVSASIAFGAPTEQ